MGPKCASCVNHNNQGHCSKYAKKIVIDPPYTDKKAQQREILASGNSTEVSFADIVNNNSHSIVAEFHMNDSAASEIELNPEPVLGNYTVELGGASFDL
jgi:hypothetical protein